MTRRKEPNYEDCLRAQYQRDTLRSQTLKDYCTLFCKYYDNGTCEKEETKVVRDTEYRASDRNLGRGEDRGEKGKEKVLIR